MRNLVSAVARTTQRLGRQDSVDFDVMLRDAAAKKPYPIYNKIPPAFARLFVQQHLDLTTGIGWVVDERQVLAPKVRELGKQIASELDGMLEEEVSLAAERDDSAAEDAYRTMAKEYLRKVKVTFSPVTSSKTKKKGWKVIVAPALWPWADGRLKQLLRAKR